MRGQWLLIVALSRAAEALVPRAAAAVDASTIQGKYMFGYQGWSRSPGKGLNTHWCTEYQWWSARARKCCADTSELRSEPFTKNSFSRL